MNRQAALARQAKASSSQGSYAGWETYSQHLDSSIDSDVDCVAVGWMIESNKAGRVLSAEQFIKTQCTSSSLSARL